jgi:RNA polymerase sigma-70 factor (ECF subfamily)
MAEVNDISTSLSLLRKLHSPDNDEAAWRTFLERYHPIMLKWCRRSGLTHHDVEEACEAVLSKLVKAMRSFIYDPTYRFRGWLKTVVENEVRSFWRARSRRPGDRGSGDSRVHETLEGIQARRDLDDLARQLDDALEYDMQQAQEVMAHVKEGVKTHTWQAFWLTTIQQEPAADVARKLSMSVGAVYEAKRRVGRMLRNEGVKLQSQAEDRKRGES